MKHTYLLVLFRCLAFCLPFQGAAQGNYATNKLIIRFNTGVKCSYAKKSGIATFGIRAIDELNVTYKCYEAKKINMGKGADAPQVYILKFKTSIDIKKAQKDYEATGLLKYAEPDYKGGRAATTTTLPNDTYFSRQWSLKNDGTFPYDSAIANADIKMTQAWDIEKGSSSVIVAVLDGGAKLNHPEFSGRIWTNTGEIPNNGIDDDGNGYIDDVQGWNFSYSNNNPTDDEGHGTNVSGIIGANADNNSCYAGMDWHCKLMELKVTDSTGFGYYSDWADAITYATDKGAKVINMSLGGNSSSQVMQDAITYAYQHNVTVVAAMGNGNTQAASYPAACTHVIPVGATNAHDVRCHPFFWGGGSNYNTYISIVAPGDYIYGLYHLNDTDCTWYWGGTSQATPHVSALAALLLAQDGSRTPDMLKHIIEVTADDQVGNPAEDVAGWDKYYGWGRINAYRALNYQTAVANITQNEDAVKIYPNPSTGQINVRVLRQQNNPLHYAVMNITGALITQGELSTNDAVINLAAQPRGTYFINIKGDNFNTTQKEVLQ